ncbi:MAG: signal peptide peptidase SppA [Chloroflexi bacterium]|nr:signal peptide peptidase SppA [Chloroflexota bacterium]
MAEEKDTNRGLPVWLWIVIGLVLLVIVPVAGCGAFGLAVGASAGGASVQTAVRPSVAVIRVEGALLAGDSIASGTVAGSRTIIEMLEQANNDSNIRAIVLRINSPGGGVTASEEIHHAITQVDKPVVVSMGTTAASGGYYIAAPADRIYAAESTITGSIGVISQFITAEQFLDDVGVEVVYVTSGDLKDFGAIDTTLTEDELDYWQQIIDDLHEDFIDVVAEGRDMSRSEVAMLADGRIYTGQQAVEVGLVDAIGYLDDAIAHAGELGGIGSDPPVVELTPQPTFFESLAGFSAPQQEPSIPDLIREMAAPTLEYRYIGP